MDLSSETMMVTGATGVLGRAVVRRYLEAGAHAAIAVRDRAAGDALHGELGELSGTAADPRLIVLEADPADRAAMDRVVDDVTRRWGRLDALANLAGTYAQGAPWDIEAMEGLWHANVHTAVVATAACLRPMRARRYGRIVSVGAFGANRGGTGTAGYAMSKTALVRWTESLAASLKDEGITANVVQPSIIDHPVNRRDMPKADWSKWVKPDELASLILFLTSREASGVTGAAIPVTART